ncbi:MAG: hypothetical protein GZ094_06870 [Mariniphaga sp.]|nr:hypothetical protein [Mariniphaga sp.]
MKKATYLFLMIVGMTLASVNVNAQDAKSTTAPVKKEASSCCKSGEKMAEGKTCSKEAAAACANKGTASADKPAACCKSKAEATTSEVKDSKKIN